MKSSRVASVLAALAVIACTAFSCGNPAPVAIPRTGFELLTFGTVKDAVDGDTVHLTDGRTIRVLAVDTPEMHDPQKRDAHGKYIVECGAVEASAYAHRELDGQRVRVQGDPTQDEKDRYGRPLAYLIFPDGRNYSVMVAGAGWAHAYAFHKSNPPEAYADVKAAEMRAAQARIGIWGQCGGKP